MNRNYQIFAVIYLAFTLTQSIKGQEIDVAAGTTADNAAGVISLFGNEGRTLFDTTTPGVAAAGYFTAGFDFASESNALNTGSSQSIDSLLSNFNVLASGSFDDVATTPVIWSGYLSVSNPNLLETAGVAGSTPYMLTLGGVNKWADALNATEIGLFTDSSFPVVPSGGLVTPESYNITTLTYDNILIGGSKLSDDLSSYANYAALANAGFTANIYTSKAIPEPSTYALFFGVFSLGFVIWRKRAVKNTAKQ